jgi:hypothetical protein
VRSAFLGAGVGFLAQSNVPENGDLEDLPENDDDLL